MRARSTCGWIATSAMIVVMTAACATPRDQLSRSQQAFEASAEGRALVLLRDLEPDVRRLDTADRARYAYLRGMSDHRLGHRVDARHWLALALAYEETTPGLLPAAWKARSVEALDEMNAIVQEGGIQALAASRRPSD